MVKRFETVQGCDNGNCEAPAIFQLFVDFKTESGPGGTLDSKSYYCQHCKEKITYGGLDKTINGLWFAIENSMAGAKYGRPIRETAKVRFERPYGYAH